MQSAYKSSDAGCRNCVSVRWSCNALETLTILFRIVTDDRLCALNDPVYEGLTRKENEGLFILLCGTQ